MIPKFSKDLRQEGLSFIKKIHRCRPSIFFILCHVGMQTFQADLEYFFTSTCKVFEHLT